MITMALAADSGFAKQLGAALASISSTQDEDQRVFVLNHGFDPALRRDVEWGAPSAEVTWVDVDTRVLADIQVPPYLGAASIFRLLLPSLLPAHVDRFIYLDADVLVRAPLGALWSTDLAGASTGAVRDAVIPWAGSPGALPWRALGLEPTCPYFNVGVLLVDLDRWRADGTADKALGLVRRRDLNHADQCAINIALGGALLQLDATWNVQAGHYLADESAAWLVESADALDRALADPVVVHFNTSPLGRPWASNCSHPYRDEWFEALDRTAWAGWRPNRRRELLGQLTEGGLPRRLTRRVEVAGRVLLHGE
ncbi:MAG: hypothetical protein GEV08_19975 [Acidimicrobiia bacterium]|nr:hypothetical protein [Acidimicrobiia bacterium]